MKLYADGIVTNQFNHVLLIRRNDSRTWAPPGGAVEAGELPTNGAAREVAEETGIQVLPVRLVGVYYRPEKPGGILLFSFRCLKRGGELATSKESPQVGYFESKPLPGPMLPMHTERLERALGHDGGPPYWGVQPMPAPVRLVRWLVYNAFDLGRALRGEPTFQTPPQWEVGAFVVVRNPAGEVLWVKRRDHDVWNLPGGRRDGMEAPWETAIRETREETGLAVRLTDLSGVYVKPDPNRVVLTFTADVTGGQLRPGPEAAAFDYFAPGAEPENTLPKHVERVADATGQREKTIFRTQTGPAGLEVLGLTPS